MKGYMRGEFSFDGIMMRRTYGVAVDKVHDMILPPARKRKINIPNRDGSYDFGVKNWDERTVILDCNISKILTRAELRDLSYTLSKKSRIVLWTEPEKYYIGQIYNPDVFNKIGRGQQSFSLEFTCEPYAYGEISTQELSVGTNTVNYKGTAETPCLLILQNTGETAVSSVRIGAASMSESYAGIYQYSLTRFGLRGEGMRLLSDCLVEVEMAPGDELRINSENFTVTLNGENMLHLQRGSWPMMSRDVNALTIEAEGGEVSGTLVYQERWL